MSTRRSRPRSDLRALLVGAGVIVLIALVWVTVRPDRTRKPQQRTTEAGDVVRRAARQAGVDPAMIKADAEIRKIDGVFVRSWVIGVESCPQARRVASLLEEAFRGRASMSVEEAVGCPVATIEIALNGEAFDIRLAGRQRKVKQSPTPEPLPTPTPTLPPDSRGRLAILLDDGGQNPNLVEPLMALPRPIAVSILPFLPATTNTASQLYEAGHEVWLHLPMEPEPGSGDPGPGVVLTTMPEQQIRRTVRSALSNVPFIVGVNNHMGSRATADLRTMTWVMQELAARGLVFLDSRTTARTVAEDAARAQGVPTGRRHVFLDNEKQADLIRRQLDEAVYRARRDGQAIAIGHVHPVTIQVLERRADRLWKEGVELVPPSRLMR